MKTIKLQQGLPEWANHRASHWNASDAPAMLGISPYKTRAALIREVATGVAPEIDDATQLRFNDGHRYEALARPLAEQILAEDLYPVTGVSDDEPRLSASFDGLTLAEDTAFEHKSLNDDLRAAMVDGCTGAELPEHYRVQMEQQCMVSGAEQVLFMASKWDGDSLVEERHCWYRPDPALRARILAGWAQFDADVAAYAPEVAAAPAAVGRAPDALPALSVQVTGMVTASNLAEYKAYAMSVLGSINRDLKTDDDFANAEQTVKWCKGVEDRLDATKQQVLGQTADIEAVFRTMDEVSAETRRIRLELDKLVTREKEARRLEIVQAGAAEVREHYDTINATLGEHRIQPAQSLQLDIAAAIKGKKSLASMKDAVDAAAANAKIAGSLQAERVRANVAILAEHPDHASLFADRVQLCATKQPEDLRNLVAARIADYQQREVERLERERERIRQEEADTMTSAAAPAPVAAVASTPAPAAEAPAPALSAVPAADPGRRIRLGDINASIAPLTITADGLGTLGFRPVCNERAAKLYAESDLPAICQKLIGVLQQAPARSAQKAAA